MSTALLDAPASAGAHATDLREIPIGEIHESSLNPRKHFDAAGLAELGESLKGGQLNPVLVRPKTWPENPNVGDRVLGYELAAGHRRLRAAKKAGLTHLLAIVREMTDREFLEVLTIENLQRQDVTPIEEATGFKQLLDHGGYDVPALAKKIGKSEESVYARLKLLELAPAPRKALEEGKITASHGVLLARLDPEVQKAVTQDLGVRQRGGDSISVRDLNHIIDEQVRFKQREDAIAEAIAQAEKDHPGEKIHQLVDHYSGDKGVLGHGEWKEVAKDTEGAKVGILIPPRYGRLEKVKRVYFVKPKQAEAGGRRVQPALSDKEVRAREKVRQATEDRKFKIEAAGRLAIARKATAPLRPEVLAMVAANLMHMLYGPDETAFWELVGLKAPSGFRRGDVTEKALAKLPAERLVQGIVFALMSNDMGDGEDNVARLAKLFKVDVKKARADAEAALAPVQTPAKPKRLAGDVRREKKAKKAGRK